MSAILIPGLVAVLILLALGVPIYLVLMGVASFLLLLEGRSVAGLGQHVLDHLNSPILIAVPFFILAAVLMRGGGLAKVLFDAATAWIGWLPGGLNLFVMSNVTGRPVSEALRGTAPFFLIMLCLLMLVTFVPALSTWLPNLILGG
jgi:C4-dicarboxylate transporter DctM subunit